MPRVEIFAPGQTARDVLVKGLASDRSVPDLADELGVPKSTIYRARSRDATIDRDVRRERSRTASNARRKRSYHEARDEARRRRVIETSTYPFFEPPPSPDAAPKPRDPDGRFTPKVGADGQLYTETHKPVPNDAATAPEFRPLTPAQRDAALHEHREREERRLPRRRQGVSSFGTILQSPTDMQLYLRGEGPVVGTLSHDTLDFILAERDALARSARKLVSPGGKRVLWVPNEEAQPYLADGWRAA